MGRDIVPGRWSFQLVEEYDTGYWDVFRDAEVHARAKLGGPVAQRIAWRSSQVSGA